MPPSVYRSASARTRRRSSANIAGCGMESDEAPIGPGMGRLRRHVGFETGTIVGGRAGAVPRHGVAVRRLKRVARLWSVLRSRSPQGAGEKRPATSRHAEGAPGSGGTKAGTPFRRPLTGMAVGRGQPCGGAARAEGLLPLRFPASAALGVSAVEAGQAPFQHDRGLGAAPRADHRVGREVVPSQPSFRRISSMCRRWLSSGSSRCMSPSLMRCSSTTVPISATSDGTRLPPRLR